LRDKIYTIIISAIFLFLLIWCPVVFALDKLDIAKLPENKNIKLPEKIYQKGAPLAPLMNSIEEGKATLENIYSNALPMYEQITIFMSDNDRSMRRNFMNVLYSFEKTELDNINIIENIPGQIPENPEASININTEEPTEPEESQVKYKVEYIGSDWCNDVWAFTEEGRPFSEGWTDKTLLAGKNELVWRVETQVGHVNRIANANKNVNFYVYVCTRFQETQIFGEIIKDLRAMRNEFSTYDYMLQFFDGLDMSAVNAYDYFKIDTVEKRIEYINKTDHHESAMGAYSIYCDIINMIENDAPGIGSPKEVEFDYIEGVELRGSHVWNHGYTEIYDNWWYYNVDLPDDRILYEWIDPQGEPKTTTKRQLDKYLSGKYPKDTFADHYYQFWPRIAYAHYPSNNTGRNLLMITDSYSWSVSELLTSHFDYSYATYPSFRENWNLNYNEFIRKNNITDVVIFNVADRLLFDIQNDIQFNRTLTD